MHITVWAIFGVILAVICLLLFLKIKVRLFISKEGTITVKYLFIKYSHYFINSDKNKSKGKKSKENENSISKHFKEKGYVEGISQLAEIIKAVFEKIWSILKKGQVLKLRLVTKFSDGEAASTAITYGAVSAVLYPLLGWVNSCFNIKKQEVAINAVYKDESFLDFEFELEVALRAFELLSAGCGFIWELIIKNIKGKG